MKALQQIVGVSIAALAFASTSPSLFAQESGPRDSTLFTEGQRLYEPDALSPEQITTRLASAFDQIEALREVELSVEAGIVVLSGTAPRQRARQRAEAIAWRLPGVLDVENLIEVVEVVDPTELQAIERTVQDEAIEEQLTRIFNTVEELRNIEVTVEGGVVQLRGTVPTTDYIARAEDFASGVEGVVFVANHIEIVRAFGKRLRPVLNRSLQFLEDVILYLPLIFVGALVILLFAFIARLVTRMDMLYRRLSDKPLVQNIVRQITGTATMIVGILLVLEIFGVTTLVGAVLGTAGLAGLALGFAFRDIAENYLASIMLSLRRPFHQNDWIRIDEHDGKVVRLTTRDTLLLTLDGNHVRIPNATVFKSVIHNYTRNPRRRLVVEVGVSYDADLATIKNIGVQALCAMETVMETPSPFAWVESFDEFDIKIGYYGWVDQRTHDFLNVLAEARRQIKIAFDKAEVAMPFPILSVKFDDDQSSGPHRSSLTGDIAKEIVATRDSEEIDEQIEAERRSTDEPDLLDE